MKAATQERLRYAQAQISYGSMVFITLKSSGRERRVFALDHTQHNIRAIFDDGDHWQMFEPEEFVAFRVMEVEDE